MVEGTCSEADCSEPVRAKQRCRLHYNRWLHSPQNPNAKQCSARDCVELARSKGMCQTHYNEWYYKDGRRFRRGRTCSVPDCDRPHQAQDYCGYHHYRHRNGIPLDAERLRIKTAPDERVCFVMGCDKPLEAKRMCGMHYARFSQHGDPIMAVGKPRGKGSLCEVEMCPERPGERGLCLPHDDLYLAGEPLGGFRYARRHRSPEGYILTRLLPSDQMWRATGYTPEHRVILACALGRPLVGDENVHHLNGDRADNRLENLELWVKSQPTGQRPADLVAWAREILDRYGEMVDQAVA